MKKSTFVVFLLIIFITGYIFGWGLSLYNASFQLVKSSEISYPFEKDGSDRQEFYTTTQGLSITPVYDIILNNYDGEG